MPNVKTIEALRQELRVKERQLGKLVARRGALAARLAMVDRKIAAMGGQVPPVRRRTRRKRAAGGMEAAAGRALKKAPRRGKGQEGQTLGSCIVQVLGKAKAPMRIKEITPAVKAAGYRSKSKDLYGLVATTLRDTTRFRRVGRGKYTLA